MGTFITAEEIQAKTLLPAVKEMQADDIDDRLIDPAERMIEEGFNLDLDTDGDPSYFAGTFDNRPRLRTQFQKDYKQSLILLIDRMAINPHGYGSQTLRGASVGFGSLMPHEVKSLMNRWARPPTLFRR